MKLAQVAPAFTAVKFDFPKNLRLVNLLAKTAVTILNITSGENNPISHFKEFGCIAALGAGDTQSVFYVNHDGPVVAVIVCKIKEVSHADGSLL